MFRLGLISDTHGLLRPEMLDFLRGADRIVHAGDIGNSTILDALAELAPLTAVRGNNDRGAWAEALKETEIVQAGQAKVCVIHEISRFRLDPPKAGLQVVVYGHSHKPVVDRRDGVLYVNPGSAGPRRFSLPIAAGELLIDGDTVTARIVEFPPPRK